MTPMTRPIRTGRLRALPAVLPLIIALGSPSARRDARVGTSGWWAGSGRRCSMSNTAATEQDMAIRSDTDSKAVRTRRQQLEATTSLRYR
jgi:hypothetical protein